MFELLLVWLVLTVQLDEAATIKNSQIANELSLPPVKLHCSSKCTLEGGGAEVMGCTRFIFICKHRDIRVLHTLTMAMAQTAVFN